MNFLKALNPEGLQNYNQVVASINLKDPDVYSTTPELNKIRDIIGLTNSAYDFGLQTALVCVNTYPEILKQTGEKNLIPYIASYERPLITIDSGKLVPLGNQFNVSLPPYKVFKNLNLTIQFVTNSSVRLTLDDETWVVPAEFNLDILIVHFPKELESLKFSIQLLQNWVEGASITIGLSPNGYPFRHVVNMLRETQEFIAICNKHGLLDSFLSIPELPYKLAIATIAVYKEQYEQWLS